MTRHPPSPFQALADWHNNSCINNYMQFEELAQSFLRSADALVARATDDTSTLDVHTYAICFLYRHSFELLLKDLSWKVNYAAHGNKDYEMRHGLLNHWRNVVAQARTLLGAESPLTAEEIADVDRLFASFEEHDPRSDSFRYPWDSKKQRTHKSLSHVNVRALGEHSHRVEDCLRTLLSRVTDHYGKRSECDAEYRSEYEAELRNPCSR